MGWPLIEARLLMQPGVQTTDPVRRLRQRADAFEDGVECGRGAVERQVADVEVPRADVDHCAQCSCADVNGCGARGKLGGERFDGDREKSAQLLECPQVRTAV